MHYPTVVLSHPCIQSQTNPTPISVAVCIPLPLWPVVVVVVVVAVVHMVMAVVVVVENSSSWVMGDGYLLFGLTIYFIRMIQLRARAVAVVVYMYIDVQMILWSSTIALGMTRRLETGIRNVEEIFWYSCQTLVVDDVKMNLLWYNIMCNQLALLAEFDSGGVVRMFPTMCSFVWRSKGTCSFSWFFC